MTGRARRSAGLLPFRFRDGSLEVLIAHMGGPFWARKDDGASEIDRAAWFDCETARRKLVPGQAPFIDALKRLLVPGGGTG